MNVYDFDKTIYVNDSSTDFFIFCLKRHPKILLQLPEILVATLKFYVFKKGSKTQMKTKIMGFVKNIDYEKDIKDFWKKNKCKIKAFYKAQQKEDDVIISASPAFVLEPICKSLGIKHLICSDVDVNTGEFRRENCYNKEKVVRYKEIFGDAPINDFYSDSYSDTPLAELAKKAYIVKGEELIPWDFSKK